MRSVASVPLCFLFLFFSRSLRAAFPLQTPAPKAAATAQKDARDATLKLYVVGHTDNQGGLDMNMDLSHRRADAVLTALTTKYVVPAGCGHMDVGPTLLWRRMTTRTAAPKTAASNW